jgi:hypothetical protein
VPQQIPTAIPDDEIPDMNIRITAEEMVKLGRSSILLGDGSGDSLGSLGKTNMPPF